VHLKCIFSWINNSFDLSRLSVDNLCLFNSQVESYDKAGEAGDQIC